MKRSFFISTLIFFIPIVVGVLYAEYLSRDLTSGYRINSEYLKNYSNEIEVLILGSSQMKDGINPAYLNEPAINLASGDQHHNTDFKLLKGLIKELPELETVVLEVSYSHFEIPHNNKDFWKNSIYLEYYGINTFERKTYFKDRLIFLSNRKYFSEKIKEQYLDSTIIRGYNKFGYDTLNYQGLFKRLEYDKSLIADTNFKINLEPNLDVFQTNSKLFYSMLDYLEKHNLNIIICNPPMYKTYLGKRNPDILKRRNSVLEFISEKYNNIKFLNSEFDTINYNVKDFTNQSHLNPSGAKKFTLQLDKKLN